jgi:hypothetical protein
MHAQRRRGGHACWRGDGLAVVDLRSAHIAVDLELAAQAVDDDVKVQLTHALDHCLVGLLVT